jgi:hypothetical protein
LLINGFDAAEVVEAFGLEHQRLTEVIASL